MRLTLFTAFTILFLSCSNDKKATEHPRQVSKLKSDILLETSAKKTFSAFDQEDNLYLMICGESLLEATAILKVTNAEGEEIKCISFPAKQLIQPEYKTANSSLKKQHLKEVVEGFFVEDLPIDFLEKEKYVGI